MFFSLFSFIKWNSVCALQLKQILFMATELCRGLKFILYFKWIYPTLVKKSRYLEINLYMHVCLVSDASEEVEGGSSHCPDYFVRDVKKSFTRKTSAKKWWVVRSVVNKILHVSKLFLCFNISIIKSLLLELWALYILICLRQKSRVARG